jgi:hypothetical protein
MPFPSQERPIFLVLPGRARIADAFRAVLSHENVRAWAMPPLWDLAWGEIEALKGVPDVRHVDLETVGRVVAHLLAAGTPEARERHVARTWAEASPRVREFFLKRSAVAVVASLMRVGKPSAACEPPPQFRSDAVHEARFEAAYRLHTVPGAAAHPEAPPEEASLVFYPFDPENADGRAEAGLDPKGREAVLEAFAYDAGRTRHREHLQAVARANGWRVVDPSAD